MPSILRLVATFAIIVVLAVEICQSLAAQEPQPEQKSTFKRRDDSTDEDLRKQLLLVSEVGFDQAAASVMLNFISKAASSPKTKGGVFLAPDMGMNYYAQISKTLKKPDLFALPWRTGLDTQLGKESAEELHVYSMNLRLCLQQSVPAKDVRPDPDKLVTLLNTGAAGAIKSKAGGQGNLKWDKTECVATLAQMLQTENTPLRLMLVDMLDKIEGKHASVILAQRAIFDLSPKIREKAVEALVKRPAKEFQAILLDGLRWPWQPAADHAAEAIGAIKLKDALPELVGMLKEPDPKYPFVKGEGKEKGTYVREVVRMNHMSNCLLCHAPSLNKDDLVRGRIPVPGQEMPPLYYAEHTGSFVRADTTFLRQDFSLVQPVVNPGKWPGQQRYDYMLRTRKATNKEITLLQGLQKDGKLDAPYYQRDAVLFALRETTGLDHGTRTESWQQGLQIPFERKKSAPK
jgi:hypothetical protein